MSNKLIVPSTSTTARAAFGTDIITTTENVNTVLIRAVFSYIYTEHPIYDEQKFTFKLEDLRAFIGISRGGKSLNLREALVDMSKVKVLLNNTETKLLHIEFIGRYVTLTSEYFNHIAVLMKQEARGGSRYTSLVNTSIIKARNTSAAEIAVELCVLVERRGSSGDKTSHIAISTLLDRCRSFRHKIDKYDSVSRKNMFLTRDIQRALELLITCTTLYQEYKDVEITVKDRITITDLKEVIKICHNGKIRKED